MRTGAIYIFLLMATMVICAIDTTARVRTTRGKLTPIDTSDIVAEADSTKTITLYDDEAEEVAKISGYDKPLRTNKESFHITNLCNKRITGLTLSIDYRDMDDRQLHQRLTAPISCDVPAGETRQINIESWDKQQTFVYHRSRLPRNSTQAALYKVKIKVVEVQTQE